MFQRSCGREDSRITPSFLVCFLFGDVRIALLRLLILGVPALFFGWSGSAHAGNCASPQTMTVANNQSVTVSIDSCSPFGIGGIQTAPLHGSLPGIDPTTGSGAVPVVVTYQNDGGPFSTDTFTIKDDANIPIVFNVTITGSPPPLTVTPVNSANPVIGAAFSQSLSTTGGVGPYHYSTTLANLPNGVTMNTQGVFSGIPTQTGSFTFAVTVTDSTSPTPFTVVKNYSMIVAIPVLTLSTAATLPNAMGNTPYSQQLATTGGSGSYTYAVSSGSLPQGLTLSASGLISGTPTTASTVSFTVSASDTATIGSDPNSHPSTAKVFSLTVDPPPPPPIAGPTSMTVPYGSTANPVALTLSGGAATSLLISGPASHGTTNVSGTTITYTPTPGYAGPDAFSYTAHNAGGTSGAAPVSITVSPPTMSMAPAGTTLSGTGSNPFTQTFQASGGTGIFTYALTGALPGGVTFDPTTAVLSGTPTAAGSFTFTVTGTDTSTGTGAPFPASKTYTLNVAVPTLVLTPSILGTQPQRGVAFSQQLTTANGLAPYAYAVTGGVLPAGLTLAGDTISGPPTAAGAYNFTVTSTDSAGFSVSVAYSGTTGAGAPIASGSSMTVPYGSSANAITLSLSGGTATSATITTQASHGTATVAGANITYTPTPGYAGPDSFGYTAGNTIGSSGAATVSITVSPPTLAMTAPAGTSLNATAASVYTQTFAAGGGSGTYTYALTGTPPSGVTFNAASATLSGTPTQAGSFSFTVTATDTSTGTNAPFSVSVAYTLNVGAPGLTMTPGSITPPERGVAYSQQLTTVNGISPYHYAATGVLPPGVTVSPLGLISGTPGTVAAYNFTVTATDSSTSPGFTVQNTYTGTVGGGAPITAASSATVAYGSTANAIALSLSGGVATTATVTIAALHGTAAVTGANITYTPTSGYAGTDSFSYTAGNTVGTSGAAIVTITVSPPTLIATPSGSWTAGQGVSYSQTLTWSGGKAPYAGQSVTGLPAGLSVTSTTANSLTISGTTTQFGSFSLTASATDSSTGTGPFSISLPFTLVVSQAAPTVLGDSIGTNANAAVTIPVTNNDSGAITSITIGTPPTHGTAVVNGLSVLYTPAANYFGSDSFTYNATGPGGTSASPATVTITVAALAAPASPPQSANVLPGQSVTIHTANGASNGPFTALVITSPPASGTAVVSGTDILYTAPGGFSGNVQLSYTLANAFATSLPIVATINVSGVPTASAQSGAGAAGSIVLVNLMTGATNGPFTAAAVAAVTPSTAGTAVITDAGTPGNSSYRLRFTAAPAFSGTVTIGYTLSNAAGISAVANVSIAIAGRMDAAKDAQVTALVASQTTTANRFATTQLSNFARRLESLHGDGWARSTFGVSLAPTTAPVQPQVVQWQEENDDRMVSGGVGSSLQPNMRKVGWTPQDQAGGSNNAFGLRALGGNNALGVNNANSGGNGNNAVLTAAAAGAPVADNNNLPELPGRPDSDRQSLSLWAGGSVDFGQRNANGEQEGFKFTSSGVSMGVDYRVNEKLTLGVGGGFSRDSADIGDNGSTNKSVAIVGSLYGSLRPTKNIFIDGVIGYGTLNFDMNRYVTSDGTFATGSRGGNQLFTAISSGYEFHQGSWMLSPYGRLELSSTTLNQYTENGVTGDALTYFQQTSRTSAGILGVRSEGQLLTRVGVWEPRVRVEYTRQFAGSADAGISYADLASSGPAYVLHTDGQTTSTWTAGLGFRLLLRNGMSLIADYSSNLNIGQGRYQSILLGVTMPLP